MSISSSCYLPQSLFDLVNLRCLKKINTSSATLNAQSTNLSGNSLITNTLGSSATNITCDGGVNGGSSPTISISSISNDLYGRISITIGSSPSGNELIKINLNKKYVFCCAYVFPFNSNLANNYDLYCSVDNSGLVSVVSVNLNSTTTTSQQLIFNYVIFGK